MAPCIGSWFLAMVREGKLIFQKSQQGNPKEQEVEKPQTFGGMGGMRYFHFNFITLRYNYNCHRFYSLV